MDFTFREQFHTLKLFLKKLVHKVFMMFCITTNICKLNYQYNNYLILIETAENIFVFNFVTDIIRKINLQFHRLYSREFATVTNSTIDTTIIRRIEVDNSFEKSAYFCHFVK